MQAIAGERVRRFAGGLRTVAETAVFAQIIATVRYPVVTRRARWRAGESTDKQNILLKNDVDQRGRITRNPANWQNLVNKSKNPVCWQQAGFCVS
ncbi:hypothetical protein AMK97_25775 [Escherichia coli]|nr:hypothetical protein AMK97_25775 [Escherichia coli]